ncbi:hypothetical protein GIB67_017184 [Kingdonia uniflora]|uniref:BHLH domain-containing protein n=1 Tax=Kingdonia uniflora TaxID=39325 RepID=A0A7J7NKC5_9MAGN|nr:hypothetical protein GIB67_017184 [Kingdonia uniflora]
MDNNQGFFSHEALIGDLSFHNLINESNFQQFMDIINGENTNPIDCLYNPNFDGDLMLNAHNNSSHCVSTPGHYLFDFNSTSTSSPNSILNTLQPSSGEVEERDEEENNGDGSSGTPTTKITKGDRSKTLVSERMRRGRMKEKLYALRSLVPNITKMDKASIVGDAVSYIQELQVRANTLESEIVALQPSLKGESGKFPGLVEDIKCNQVKEHEQCLHKKILQMNVFQVEERGFYVRVASNKGKGVAVALYKALESLTCFDIQSTNFTTVSETLVLTFTMNVRECGEEMNLTSLKLWLTGVLMNQGFEFSMIP